MTALIKIENILLEYGLSAKEIYCLLAQFLEEEAKLYEECINTIK